MHSPLRNTFPVVLVLSTAAAAPSGADPDPGITAVGETPGGRISFTLNSDTETYHILRRSRQLHRASRGRAVAMVRGTAEGVSIADSSRRKEEGYYQLTHLTAAASRDSDRDGVSDWVELNRPGVYNPLNPAPPVG